MTFRHCTFIKHRQILYRETVLDYENYMNSANATTKKFQFPFNLFLPEYNQG